MSFLAYMYFEKKNTHVNSANFILIFTSIASRLSVGKVYITAYHFSKKYYL
jgi:hypothetical protein